ncbi:MAG: hypothetical protein GC160_15080 [Acidobacteria bacterium]|nr:hypothetical protein [Acidobacteriota bacterium]
MNRRVGLALFSFALCLPVGCARRQPPAAAAPFCVTPTRALVAEAEDERYGRLATDELAEGLSRLGFQVLAPRREAPHAGVGAVNDWIFTPEIARDDDGGLEINVELYSLRQARRLWAITDALSEAKPADEAEGVRMGIQTALQMFQNDRLRCGAPE